MRTVVPSRPVNCGLLPSRPVADPAACAARMRRIWSGRETRLDDLFPTPNWQSRSASNRPLPWCRSCARWRRASACRQTRRKPRRFVAEKRHWSAGWWPAVIENKAVPEPSAIASSSGVLVCTTKLAAPEPLIEAVSSGLFVVSANEAEPEPEEINCSIRSLVDRRGQPSQID